MAEHKLKCWPEFFHCILTGEKTFEVRKDDRGFRADDVLWLREWYPSTKSYSGREVRLTVTYLLSGFGVELGYVVMGFAPPARPAEAEDQPNEQCPVCHVPAIPATWWKCPACGWLREREGAALVAPKPSESDGLRERIRKVLSEGVPIWHKPPATAGQPWEDRDLTSLLAAAVATVAALTQERDGLLAENDLVHRAWDASIEQGRQLEATVAAQQATIRDLLTAPAWIPAEPDGALDSELYCPLCGRWKVQGHTADCQRARAEAVLAAAEARQTEEPPEDEDDCPAARWWRKAHDVEMERAVQQEQRAEAAEASLAAQQATITRLSERVGWFEKAGGVTMATRIHALYGALDEMVRVFAVVEPDADTDQRAALLRAEAVLSETKRKE